MQGAFVLRLMKDVWLFGILDPTQRLKTAFDQWKVYAACHWERSAHSGRGEQLSHPTPCPFFLPTQRIHKEVELSCILSKYIRLCISCADKFDLSPQNKPLCPNVNFISFHHVSICVAQHADTMYVYARRLCPTRIFRGHTDRAVLILRGDSVPSGPICLSGQRQVTDKLS